MYLVTYHQCFRERWSYDQYNYNTLVVTTSDHKCRQIIQDRTRNDFHSEEEFDSETVFSFCPTAAGSDLLPSQRIVREQLRVLPLGSVSVSLISVVTFTSSPPRGCWSHVWLNLLHDDVTAAPERPEEQSEELYFSGEDLNALFVCLRVFLFH